MIEKIFPKIGGYANPLLFPRVTGWTGGHSLSVTSSDTTPDAEKTW